MTSHGDTKVAEILARDAVFLGRPSESMAEAIEFVGGELLRRGVVDEGYIAGMHQRETSVSTYLGNGVALPHGTFETKNQVKGTAIVVAQYPEGVTWGNGSTAHLVVGLAAVGEDHVEVLSQLAEVLQDEDLCSRLWVTDDADFIYETLTAPVEDDEDDDEADEELEASRDVTIVNPAGLHARPAALVVERAKGVDCDVRIIKGEKSANAKSIMSVLALGGQTGDTVTVTASGAGARDAIELIVEILLSTEEEL